MPPKKQIGDFLTLSLFGVLSVYSLNITVISLPLQLSTTDSLIDETTNKSKAIQRQKTIYSPLFSQSDFKFWERLWFQVQPIAQGTTVIKPHTANIQHHRGANAASSSGQTTKNY